MLDIFWTLVLSDTFWMLSLGILGGFIAGIQNALRAKFVRHLGVPVDVATVSSMAGAAISGIAGGILITGIPELKMNFWIPFFISSFLNIFIQFWNLKAMSLEDASIVNPLLTAQPVIAIFASWIILQQWPTFWGKIGISVIALGAYMLYLKGKPVELPTQIAKIVPQSFHKPLATYAAPWIRLWSSKGARLALLCAWIGAISINFDQIATLASNPFFLSGGAFAVVALAVLSISYTSGQWSKQSKKHFEKVFLIGILMGIGVVVQNSVFYFAIAPYVGALRRTQVLWVVIFSGMFLGEKHTFTRFVGSLILIAGTILIAF